MEALEVLWREVRVAARRLRHRRPAAALAVATLALALGANTAMFSVYRALVLDPLPYPAAHALVWLQPASLRTGMERSGRFSHLDFLDYRDQGHGFAALGAYYPNVATLVGRGQPQHVDYANVTGEFFTALGVRPARGRAIERPDEQPNLPEVAVLGDALWHSRFGGDPGVVGRTLDLDNRPLTIVGVMPPGFSYPAGVELWTPEPLAAGRHLRDLRYLDVIGRLRPGWSLAAAQAEMTAVAAGLAARYPTTNTDQGVKLVPLSTEVAGPMTATLGMMLLAMLLVLAIACANVANLLLADAVGRWREMAVRASLGAGRRRLLGQLLVEGTVLAVVAGGVGWLLAWALLPLVRLWGAPGPESLASVHLNGTVLGFTLLATAATAVWFGLAPGWELLRSRPERSLHRAGAADAGGRSHLSSLLVIAEVATTTALLVTAGLLWQSLLRRERVSPGFDAQHVLTFRASLLYNSAAELLAGSEFFHQLDQKIATLPGVEAAGLISELPFTPPPTQLHLHAVGDAVAAAERPVEWPAAAWHQVLPGYFRALGIPVRGRGFGEDDNAHAQPVAILSGNLARQLFPGGDALGHEVTWVAAHPVTVRVVGVAGAVPRSAPGGALSRDVYVPFLQFPTGEMSVVVRARADAGDLMPALRRQVAALNPEVPVYEVEGMPERLAATTRADHLRAGLLAAMAALALALALAGLYGVLAHRVAQRRRELGVRLALGASAPQVRRLVVGQALRLILSGLALGLLAAWWLRPGLERFLFEARGGDGWTWITAPLLVLATGLLASYLPARRASQVDPAAALRCE